jgi:squalene-hopene/tetraprenyl-beta-curcumene cyclase
MRTHLSLSAAAAASLVLALAPSAAFAGPAAVSAETKAKASAAQDKAVEFLLKAQKENGQWGEDGPNPAVSGLVLRALLGSGKVDAKHPVVDKGLKYVLSFAKKDGGIYRDLLKNYNTAICLMAVHAAGRAEDRDVVKAAQKFLIAGQYGSEEHKDEFKDPKNPWYGGNGYGKEGRPDLSNTQLMLEALKETGVPETDAAFKRAQVFLSRMQLRSESNDQEWAKDVGNDGGFIYEIGASKAEGKPGADGKKLLRSYGSMTYAGFKSFLYAGLDPKDGRVQSALEWIRKNYDLSQNPYMEQQGLFYYYHTFAKALKAWDERTGGKDGLIEDARGVKHNWREELIERLVAAQQADGSWVNKGSPRWMEADPRLVTAFALMALEETLK